MDCMKFQSLMSEYFENTLDEKTKIAFENHLNECEKCKLEYESFSSLLMDIHDMEMEDLPEGYCKNLHMKLKTEKKNKVVKLKKSVIKYGSLAACFLLILFVGIKTSAWDDVNVSSNTAYEKSMDSFADEVDENFDSGSSVREGLVAESSYDKSYDKNSSSNENTNYGDTDNQQYDNKLLSEQKELKIIKNGNISVATENYDEFVSKFENIVKGTGGYFQSSSSYISFYREDKAYKNGEITARIPNDMFEDILHGIENLAEVENTNVYETDVTKQYYDIDNKIENLEIQENRLRELYSRAENLTEILQLESEITRVRTQIDSYSMSLSDLNDRVTYATLRLSIRETEDIVIEKPTNVFDKAREGFIKTINAIINALQSVFVWIVSNIIYIGITLIVVFILYTKVYKKFK